MESLTLAQIKDFAIVFLAIMAFIVLLGNVIKTVKGWLQPGMSEREWRQDVDRKLGSDNERIKTLEEGNKVICKALMAMLSHEINGNSNDKLQKALEGLNNYLIER